MNNNELKEIKDKEKVFWNILQATITLDINHGHLKWSLTQLSKESGISRSLIYYYFGKSKHDILLEAIKFFNRFILGTTPSQIKQWEKGNILPSIILAREVIEKIPAITPFFYLNRYKKNRISEELLVQGDSYTKKLKQFYPHLSEDERDAIHVIMFGLIFAPTIGLEALAIASNQITRLINQQKATSLIPDKTADKCQLSKYQRVIRIANIS